MSDQHEKLRALETWLVCYADSIPAQAYRELCAIQRDLSARDAALPVGDAVMWRAQQAGGKWMYFDYEPKHLQRYEPLYAAPLAAATVDGAAVLAQLRRELAEDKGWDYTAYEQGRFAEKERCISLLATPPKPEQPAHRGEEQPASMYGLVNKPAAPHAAPPSAPSPTVTMAATPSVPRLAIRDALVEAWADGHDGKSSGSIDTLTDNLSRRLASTGQADEISPDFTDTSRAALAWVLYHHQGGSSPVGGAIRFALGMGQHEQLSERMVSEAKRWAAMTGSRTEDFRATAGQVPEGMVLVPREPTPEMQDACLRLVDLTTSDPEDHRYDDGRGSVDLLWAAMLAAADQPGQQS